FSTQCCCSNTQTHDITLRLFIIFISNQAETLFHYQQRKLRQSLVAMQVAIRFEKERNPIMLFRIVSKPLDQLTFKFIAKFSTFRIKHCRELALITSPSSFLC